MKRKRSIPPVFQELTGGANNERTRASPKLGKGKRTMGRGRSKRVYKLGRVCDVKKMGANLGGGGETIGSVIFEVRVQRRTKEQKRAWGVPSRPSNIGKKPKGKRKKRKQWQGRKGRVSEKKGGEISLDAHNKKVKGGHKGALRAALH